MLQTQTNKESASKKELLENDPSVVTGKGEVLKDDQYEKLQTSIDNLSIDADDEREAGETQDEQNLSKQEEKKTNQLTIGGDVGQTNQQIAERQIT